MVCNTPFSNVCSLLCFCFGRDTHSPWGLYLWTCLHVIGVLGVYFFVFVLVVRLVYEWAEGR